MGVHYPGPFPSVPLGLPFSSANRDVLGDRVKGQGLSAGEVGLEDGIWARRRAQGEE